MPSTLRIKYILCTDCEQWMGSVEELARKSRGPRTGGGGGGTWGQGPGDGRPSCAPAAAFVSPRRILLWNPCVPGDGITVEPCEVLRS